MTGRRLGAFGLCRRLRKLWSLGQLVEGLRALCCSVIEVKRHRTHHPLRGGKVRFQWGRTAQCLHIRKHAIGYVGNRSGQVSIIFALSLIPLLGMVGLAIDYGRAAMVKSALDSAADETALAAVTTMTSGQPQMSPARISQYFASVAGALPNNADFSVTSTSTPSVTNISVTVNYTAKVPTVFGGLFGISKIDLSGTASAVGGLPPYVNFYLVLDNSPSMGLGATPTDIQNLENATPDQCAFACHQHTFDSRGRITGDNLNDYYHVAKNNNITTRIDVLRTATQSLMTTAMNSETVPNQFGMALYTFSDTFQTLSSMTTNLTSVQSSASNIDLAYAYYNQRDTQTSYDTALRYVANIAPQAGSGLTSSQPQEFIFLVTDGVEDEPVSSGSGSGDPADLWKNGASGWPANTQANIQNYDRGNVNSKRLITTVSQSVCTSLKNNGIKIAILYTPYLPVTNNAFYNKWVAPIASSIPTTLQSCASPGFFFQVTPTQGISEAMQAMFNAALNEARLTN